MKKLALALAASSLLVFPACKKSEPPADKGPIIGSDTPAPPAVPVAPPAPDASRPIGILAADNDPKIVAAAKAVIAACKWDPKTAWASCPELDTYHHVDVATRGAGDATLVNFVEDPDERVRSLAAEGLLYIGGGKYETDEALATRLVAALEKETCVAIDGRIAREVAKIDGKKIPALGERIKALALSPKSTNDIKVFIGAWWGSDTNADNTFAFDTSKALAVATDERVKRSALMGLGPFYAGHEDELCKLWSDAVASPDADTARLAIQLVCGSSLIYSSDEDQHGGDSTGGVRPSETACPQADAVLDAIAERAKAGKIDNSDYVSAVRAAASPEKMTPVKTKALGVLRAIVENKANTYTRSAALATLVSLDKTQKAYAQKWLADADLGDTVKNINEQK